MCNYSITLIKDEKILIILISSFHWCEDRDTSIIDFNFQHKNCQENQVIINTIQLHFWSFKDNLLLFNLFRNVFEMMARLLFVYVYYVWMWLSVYISFFCECIAQPIKLVVYEHHFAPIISWHHETSWWHFCL